MIKSILPKEETSIDGDIDEIIFLLLIWMSSKSYHRILLPEVIHLQNICAHFVLLSPSPHHSIQYIIDSNKFSIKLVLGLFSRIAIILLLSIIFSFIWKRKRYNQKPKKKIEKNPSPPKIPHGILFKRTSFF